MRIASLLALFAAAYVGLAEPASAQNAPGALDAAEAVQVNAEGTYQVALEAFKADDYQKANRFAEKAYSQSRGTKKYGNLYGWTLLKSGRIAEAEAVYKQVYALDSSYIETIQLGAWLAYFKADAGNARKGFQQELAWVEEHRANPYYQTGRYKRSDYTFIGTIVADSNYGMGLLALGRGDISFGINYLQQASEFSAYGGRRDVLLALADAQARHGDSDGASVTLQKVSDEFGAEAVAPVLARTYLLSSNPARAVDLIAPLAAKSPGNSEYSMIQALGLAAAGRAGEADQALAKSLALSPQAFPAADLVDLVAGRSPVVRQWLSGAGRRFYEQADYSEARQLLYAPAIGGDCAAKLMAAWSNHFAGYPAYALSWFKDAEAKGCAPREEAVLGQGVAELALGHIATADKLFVQSRSINPNYGRAKVARGAVSYLRKDYVGTIKIYSANMSAIPASEQSWGWGSNALNNLAWAYYFTGNYKASEATFLKLAGYNQGRSFAGPEAGLGWSLLRQGKRNQARDRFERALSLEPNNTLAKQGLDATNS